MIDSQIRFYSSMSFWKKIFCLYFNEIAINVTERGKSSKYKNIFFIEFQKYYFEWGKTTLKNYINLVPHAAYVRVVYDSGLDSG